MKKINLKVILSSALVLILLSSCTESKKTTKNDEVDTKETIQKPLVKEGVVTVVNSLSDGGESDQGFEIYFNDGSYFMAYNEAEVKLEGIKKFNELEGGKKVEITYELSAKEETTQFANAAGAEGLLTDFVNKVDGRKKTKELDLISYELKTEGNETSCTIKAKDEKGETFEFKSDLNALDRKGVFQNNFGLTAKSISIIGKTSYYKKEEKWEAVEDLQSGYTRLTLLKEDSEMAKIMITDISYNLKEMKKIKVIK